MRRGGKNEIATPVRSTIDLTKNNLNQRKEKRFNGNERAQESVTRCKPPDASGLQH
jgi:hypothetical protein